MFLFSVKQIFNIDEPHPIYLLARSEIVDEIKSLGINPSNESIKRLLQLVLSLLNDEIA